MKNLFWGASLAVGLVMSAFQAQASDDKAGSVQVKATDSKVSVSQVKMTGGAQYKLSDMTVMLDGALYPMTALSKLEGRISIIVDDESQKTGVARAYRTTEEFDAYMTEKGAQCPNAGVSATGTTEQCFFYDAADCTGWTLRLAINCGNAAGNLAGLLSIRSFSLGCGSTFVCPTTDCSGTCGIASGTAGACVNVTSGTVQCAGCANF
jgi:hypothetical protein